MKKIEDRLKELEAEIDSIKNRNHRVEGDKAWEVSNFRLALISLLTFIFSLAFLFFVKSQDYVLSALASTAGVIISSQTLPFVKKWWLKRQG